MQGARREPPGAPTTPGKMESPVHFLSALVHLTLLTSALEASSRREALTRKGSEVAANVSLSGIS